LWFTCFHFMFQFELHLMQFRVVFICAIDCFASESGCVAHSDFCPQYTHRFVSTRCVLVRSKGQHEWRVEHRRCGRRSRLMSNLARIFKLHISKRIFTSHILHTNEFYSLSKYHNCFLIYFFHRLEQFLLSLSPSIMVY
jgi:hypothetical protein